MIPLSTLEKSTTKHFSRSSGAGGQNVNKTSTRVQLSFDILGSDLSEFQKQKLLRKFSSGSIQATNQETRSQSQNTKLAFLQLQRFIEGALQKRKIRKNTKAPHLTPKGKRKKMTKEKLLKYKRRYLQ